MAQLDTGGGKGDKNGKEKSQTQDKLKSIKTNDEKIKEFIKELENGSK